MPHGDATAYDVADIAATTRDNAEADSLGDGTLHAFLTLVNAIIDVFAVVVDNSEYPEHRSLATNVNALDGIDVRERLADCGCNVETGHGSTHGV
jgi:hypothetical protein